jgi:hypothetical protein
MASRLTDGRRCGHERRSPLPTAGPGGLLRRCLLARPAAGRLGTGGVGHRCMAVIRPGRRARAPRRWPAHAWPPRAAAGGRGRRRVGRRTRTAGQLAPGCRWPAPALRLRRRAARLPGSGRSGPAARGQSGCATAGRLTGSKPAPPTRQPKPTGRLGKPPAKADWPSSSSNTNGGAATAREQHIRIEELKADFHTGKRAAVEECINRVLTASRHPSGFPAPTAKAIYLAKPRQLLFEYQFPLIDQVIPTEGTWRYNKTKDRLEVTTRPASERRERYKSLLAAITVRTLYELFTADTPGHLDSVVFNGVVEDIDPATGRQIRPTLISVRAFRDEFVGREFGAAKFSPTACLKDLRAHVSRAPAELEPVEPVLRFEPDRARVLEEEEILSTLSDH